MKGQTEGQDQLVGVMQLMIKRGTVTQERFYDAIQDIFRQMYQNMCSSGKRFYCQNKSTLMTAVGDEAADVIELSDGMNNEDFRVTVKRSLSPDEERKNVDSLALQFYQAQLLDRDSLTNILGRGTEDDLWQGIREYGRISGEAEKIQQQQMAQMQQQQSQQQQAQQQQILGMQEEKMIQDSVEKEKANIEMQEAVKKASSGKLEEHIKAANDKVPAGAAADGRTKQDEMMDSFGKLISNNAGSMFINKNSV